jgi:hypothetical protein
MILRRIVERKVAREYYGGPAVAALVRAQWYGFARRRLLASATWHLLLPALLVTWLVGGWCPWYHAGGQLAPAGIAPVPRQCWHGPCRL